MLKKRDTAKAKHAAAVHARECAIKTRTAAPVTKGGSSSAVPAKAQKAVKAVKASKA